MVFSYLKVLLTAHGIIFLRILIFPLPLLRYCRHPEELRTTAKYNGAERYLGSSMISTGRNAPPIASIRHRLSQTYGTHSCVKCGNIRFRYTRTHRKNQIKPTSRYDMRHKTFCYFNLTMQINAVLHKVYLTLKLYL